MCENLQMNIYMPSVLEYLKYRDQVTESDKKKNYSGVLHGHQFPSCSGRDIQVHDVKLTQRSFIRFIQPWFFPTSVF